MATRKKFTRNDLNEKQNAFVDEYIARGGSRAAATDAMMVVYGYDKPNASSAANRMLKNERIRDVLVEETVASFAALGVLAAEKLADILITGQWFGQPVKPSDGLKAISRALERGVGPVAQITEMNVRHEVENLSAKELRAEIVSELRKLPDNDRAQFLQMLGGEDNIIDVEAVEVDPKAPWGRKENGVPKRKPGAKPQEKRLLPGPDAYRPEKQTDLQIRIKNLKERKRRQLQAKQGEQNDGQEETGTDE